MALKWNHAKCESGIRTLVFLASKSAHFSTTLSCLLQRTLVENGHTTECTNARKRSLTETHAPWDVFLWRFTKRKKTCNAADRNKYVEEEKAIVFITMWVNCPFLVFPFACLIFHNLWGRIYLHFPDEETIDEKRTSCSYCKDKRDKHSTKRKLHVQNLVVGLGFGDEGECGNLVHQKTDEKCSWRRMRWPEV